MEAALRSVVYADERARWRMSELPDNVDELKRELLSADRERLAWQRLFAQALFLLGGTNRTLALTSQFLSNWRDDDWTVKRFDHQERGGVVQFQLRPRERSKDETVCRECRGRGVINMGVLGTKPCKKCQPKEAV